MTTETNKRLYWQWFLIFIGLAIIFAYIADSVTRNIGNPREKHKDLLSSALSLASLPAMALYGFYMNYFPGSWFNEIKRGRRAAIYNISLIVIYAIALLIVDR